MSVAQYQVRRGAYYDSLVLMQLQQGLLGLPNVIDAGVVMATPANCSLLAANNLLLDSVVAGPDDLLIVVKAESDSAARDALARVDELLARRRSTDGQDFRPRSPRSAVKLLPEAGWVLVSVPGRYAAGVAREALDLGRHVFLYSDNVSLQDEVSLKQTARAKGLLVMGPDCGTAIISGIGLGFANRVRQGSIGLVGASGTGLQAITSHIHGLGGGVSQAIGTGGRDLKAEVGAITAHQALDLLARDTETKVIVLVSKPPAAEVAARLLAAAQATGKPVVVEFIGYPPPARQLGNLHFAATLSEAAEIAVRQSSVTGGQSPVTPAPVHGYLRGLFSGGTLAYETLLGLQTTLSPIYSNAPITGDQSLKDPLHSEAHTIIDLGGDDFTVGRLHPMIDNDLRIRRLRQEAADPEAGLILLDVVLGEGAHPDPASELAPVIGEAIAKSGKEIVVIVIGTEDDPQGMQAQIEQFTRAGAVVYRDVTEAVAHISQRFISHASDKDPRVTFERFSQTPLAAINVGLESFHDSLISQGARAVQVDWRPPAGGNEKLAALLARMKKQEPL
jgi:FdrA protein